MKLKSKTLKNFNSNYKWTHAKYMATTQTLMKNIAHQTSPKDISMENLGKIPLTFDIVQESSLNIFKSIPRQHKKQKPVSRGTYERSRLSRVEQLEKCMNDPDIRNIPRAGVVFYAFINDELHMCFGRDRRSGDLTDFGGGRIAKFNETPVACAVREGNEESRCAFSEIRVDQVKGFFCLYSSNMLIIFIPVASPHENMDIREITKKNFNDALFLTHRQRRDRRYNEISEIVWLKEAQIDNIFSKRPAIQMFAKVRRFIYSCNRFSQNIHVMKSVLKSAITDIPESYNIDDLQKFYVSQIGRSPTPQEVLLESHCYHSWNSPILQAFSDFADVSPRHQQSCSASITGSIVNEDISVTHRMIRTVHLTC